MKTLNHVELIGFVGRDPEASLTSSGTPIARFSLATTDRWRGKDEQPQEHTEWHRVVFFGPAANQIIDRVRKGSLLRVEGSIRVRTYEKDGATRTAVEVRGSDWIDFERRARPGETPAAGDGTPPLVDPPADDDSPI